MHLGVVVGQVERERVVPVGLVCPAVGVEAVGVVLQEAGQLQQLLRVPEGDAPAHNVACARAVSAGLDRALYLLDVFILLVVSYFTCFNSRLANTWKIQ